MKCCPYDTTVETQRAMKAFSLEVYALYRELEKEAIACFEIADGQWNHILHITKEQHTLLASFFTWTQNPNVFRLHWDRDVFLHRYVKVTYTPEN